MMAANDNATMPAATKLQDSTTAEPKERHLSTALEGSASPDSRISPAPGKREPPKNETEDATNSKKRKRDGSESPVSEGEHSPKQEELSDAKEEGVIEEDSEDERQKTRNAKSSVPPSKRARLGTTTGNGDNDEQTRKRGARVFGVLLGTLNKAKKTSLLRAEQDKKREEIQKTVRTKIIKEKEEIARSIEKEKSRRRERKAVSAKIVAKKRERDLHLFKMKQQQNCLGLLRTRTQPVVYWLPRILTDSMKDILNEQKDKFNANKREIEERVSALNKEISDMEKMVPDDIIDTSEVAKGDTAPQSATTINSGSTNPTPEESANNSKENLNEDSKAHMNKGMSASPGSNDRINPTSDHQPSNESSAKVSPMSSPKMESTESLKQESESQPTEATANGDMSLDDAESSNGPKASFNDSLTSSLTELDTDDKVDESPIVKIQSRGENDRQRTADPPGDASMNDITDQSKPASTTESKDTTTPKSNPPKRMTRSTRSSMKDQNPSSNPVEGAATTGIKGEIGSEND